MSSIQSYMSNYSANILRSIVHLFILDVTKKECTFYCIFQIWYLQTYKMSYWKYFSITSTTFVQVYPLLRVLQHQLLLVTAKVLSPQPRVTPDSEANSGSQSSTTGVNSFGKENISYGGGSNRITPSSRSSGRASPNTPTKRDMPDTPLRPVNLNKEDWSRPGPSYHVLSTTMNIQVEERSPADTWM